MTAFVCSVCKQTEDDGLSPRQTALLESEFQAEIASNGEEAEDYVALCEVCTKAYEMFATQGVTTQ